MTTKKELTALKKEFKAMDKKLEKLLKAIEKSKTQAPKVSKAKAVKARSKETPAKKKATQVTAIDQVLNIIKRSKKGVDATTLKKKTGFNDKKIRNILFRASKEGKIQTAGRGIYIAVK